MPVNLQRVIEIRCLKQGEPSKRLLQIDKCSVR